MVNDYEDTRDLGELTDGELRDLIYERLRANDALIEETDIDVRVVAGAVTLTGRVGTEGDLQRIEQVITDEIGVVDVTSNIGIDEGLRDQQPDAADEAVMEGLDERATSGGADRTEDSAEHLMEDRAAEQYGTRDMGEAIERGYSYEPPDSPTPEGTRSREEH
ncbi:MAG TPA: BON domain-containing protein [Longimicrobiales bacterium]|nr:BON domain-containing protein [Longimicrobiales bacterium]